MVAQNWINALPKTFLLQDRRSFFVDPAIVQVFVEFLRQVAERHTFRVIYCFMPDHAHDPRLDLNLIFMGTADDSDILQGVEDFKQASGYWLESNHFLTSWQKSFHDRIIRARELGIEVQYVLGNRREKDSSTIGGSILFLARSVSTWKRS